MSITVSYYPGCEATTVYPAFDRAARAVCGALDIELVELETAGCCGSMDIRVSDPGVADALNGRILALAEETGGYNLFTLCNTCELNLNIAAEKYADEENRAELNEILTEYGRGYDGTVEVTTLPWLLIRIVGYPAFNQALERPLSDLSIAPFPGCHSMRPSEYYGMENPMKPSSLDLIIDYFLKGTPVDYPSKGSCCGFHTLMTEEDTSKGQISSIVTEAADAGSECVVTPCTQCAAAFDTYQKQALSDANGATLPVFHLSQLAGLALGVDRDELGLDSHMVSPASLLEEKGL